MKNIVITLIIIVLNSSFMYGQTKEETYKYLTDKLTSYALKDANIKYSYIIQEAKFESHFLINIIEGCSCGITTAYFFTPKDYISLIQKNKSEAIWYELNVQLNSFSGFYVDNKTGVKSPMKERNPVITIVLDKDTPKKEYERVNKAFNHLLKLYGVEKKELFD